MGKLSDVVQAFLDGDDWKYEKFEDKDIFRAGVGAKNASYSLFYDVKESAEQLIVYTITPQHVPEQYRHEVSEFLTRANYGIIIGNFEMDFDDGEVRYKTSVDVEGGELTTGMVRQLTLYSVSTTDRYFPGIMAICYGGKSAQESVLDVENPLPVTGDDLDDDDDDGDGDDSDSDELTL